MEEQDNYENVGEDIREVGFADTHRMIFDFVPYSDEVVVRLGHRFSWIGPSLLYRRVVDSGFDKPDGTDRAEINFAFDKIPQPGLWSRLFGYTSQTERIYIITKASLLYPRLYYYLDRAPSQEEADLMTAYQANAFCTGTAWPALFVAAGLARELWTASKGRWHNPLPLRFPRNYERPKSFKPGTLKLPFTTYVIRGPSALALQRIWRLSKYGLVSYLAGTVLMNSHLSTAEVRAYGDSRLKSLRDAHRKMLEHEREQALKALQGTRSQRPSKASSPSMEPRVIRTVDQPSRGMNGDSQGGIFETLRRQKLDSNNDDTLSNAKVDAASTDSGFEQNEYVRSDSAEDGNLRRTMALDSSRYDNSMKKLTTEGGTAREDNNWQVSAQSNTVSDKITQNNDQNDNFIFGEQSHAPGVTSESPSPSQTASGLGRSAWERVRRGNITPVSPPQTALSSQRGTRLVDASQGKTSEEHYTFKGDRQKESSKDQAQQEFDAMLERERSGSQAGSDETRW